MTKLSNASIAIYSVLILSMVSCNSKGKQVDGIVKLEVLPADIVELRADQIKLASIELGSVEMHQMRNVLKVNGVISVSPQNFATVCMPMGGFIKSTNLLPGNPVTKGQTIAVIENQEFIDIQQSFLEAKNKLIYAEAEFVRHTDLYKSDVYSEQNLQKVTVEYRNLKALVKSLEQKLLLIGIDPGKLSEENISSSVNLVSPINGFLTAVNVNIGKFVSSADVLFEIVNSNKLFLELSLFEKDADKVSAGQKLSFYVNNETEVHEAVLTQTGKSVSNEKTFRVYASVTSSCKNLFPGMYVNAFIEESDNKVTVLPADAVVSFDDKDYIFTYEKEKEEAGMPFTEYRMVEVEKGVSGSGFTEIKLPDGFNFMDKKIVTKGAYNLLSAKKNAGEMAC
jgi:cobalt-zinc-cadmium efflux system membrane fusion protein